MKADEILENIAHLSSEFARDRAARQQRRSLVRADFEALREAGFLLAGVPVEEGGIWESVVRSTRPICALLRTLARGDSSVALVSSMHPAVLSYWMATREVGAPSQADWDAQRRTVFQSALDGAFWGTITSEPGSGGDIARTRSIAEVTPSGYAITGPKHFGSGSGITSFMVTTAVPAGEDEADWFFFDMRGVPWDGSRGVTLLGEWDGHGMTATQSHALRFDAFPAARVAFRGHRAAITAAAGPFIGCLFCAVVTGVVDIAVETARAQLSTRHASLSAYERVEWSHAEVDGWLLSQAFEGVLRAVETKPHPQRDVHLGKIAIAELAESCLQRICRVMGGGSFARRSPYGHWFEDVRALGFLRPPWALAYEDLDASGWRRPPSSA